MEIPFHGFPVQGLPLQVTTKNLRPTISKAVPENVKLLLERCWAREASSRPSFTQILKELRLCKIDKSSVDLGLQDEALSQYLPRAFDDSLPEDERQKAPTVKYKRADSIFGGDRRELDINWDLNLADDLQMGRKLGEGMSAEVFKADFRGQVVAVKKIFFSNPDDESIVDFHKEVQLMKKLRHDNVIRMIACCVARPFAYIITEFMHHGAVYDMYTGPMHNNPPQWQIRCDMFLDVARGLAYLHSENVMHRDLKSPNIMCNNEWVTKVGDFGLSKIRDDTKTMTICGSPLWTAPEMLMSTAYSHKVDVYSFAIIMWEMFVWDEPYPGMMVVEIVKGVVDDHERPEILPKMKKENAGYVEIMKECWAQKQEDRPDMDTVVQKLEAWYITKFGGSGAK
jgi:tRNA A-37 threonylcarbamoyl transferase component Bud32